MLILTVSCWFLLPGCSSKKHNRQETETSSPSAVSEEQMPGNMANAGSIQPPVDSDTAAKSRIARQERSARRRQERLTASDNSTPKHKSLASLLKQSSQNNTDDGEDAELDFAEQTDEQLISNAISVLSSDKDRDNRITAIEELRGLDISQVLPVIKIGINDKDADVRLSALSLLEESISSQEQTTEFFIIADRNIKPLISKALSDSNEDVRTAAFMAAESLPVTIRLDILKTAITSKYIDITQESISQLTDLSTPASFEILIFGLRYIDPELKEDLDFAIDFLVSQEFNSYEDARKWWTKNKHRYDENLVELENP